MLVNNPHLNMHMYVTSLVSWQLNLIMKCFKTTVLKFSWQQLNDQIVQIQIQGFCSVKNSKLIPNKIN